MEFTATTHLRRLWHRRAPVQRARASSHRQADRALAFVSLLLRHATSPMPRVARRRARRAPARSAHRAQPQSLRKRDRLADTQLAQPTARACSGALACTR